MKLTDLMLYNGVRLQAESVSGEAVQHEVVATLPVRVRVASAHLAGRSQTLAECRFAEKPLRNMSDDHFNPFFIYKYVYV